MIKDHKNQRPPGEPPIPVEYPDSPEKQRAYESHYREAQRQGKGGQRHRKDCQCRMCHGVRKHYAKGQIKPKHKRIITKEARRQTQFIDNLTSPASNSFNNPTEAAKAAGYAPHMAESQAALLLDDGQVRGRVLAALDHHGVADLFIAARLKEGMLAESQKPFLLQKSGKLIYSKKMPDWNARFKHLEAVMRVRGDFPDEQVQQAALIIKLGGGQVDDKDWGAAVQAEVKPDGTVRVQIVAGERVSPERDANR